MRVGIGYDIHPLVPGRKLILGGVEVPYSKGLAGHSDADALTHARGEVAAGELGIEQLQRPGHGQAAARPDRVIRRRPHPGLV